MDLERTQPLNTSATYVWRCSCGNDILIERDEDGRCDRCGRAIPAEATRLPLSFSLTATNFSGSQRTTVSGEADDLVGRRLGHFEIIEPIGQGGMGRIYRALDTSLQRYVAVKVLRHLAGEREMDARQRLMREAVAQARVNHPNIVTIYYVGEENEIPFLAMELIDGHDVAELIRQGEIPYETLCGFAIRIVHALETARQMGIVHSDIKPRNLLVMTNGEVKLSDFGMARLGEEAGESSYGGTPNYLAPELLEGKPPSIKSDMYALGVTLFEMTFGKLPVALSGSTPVEWARVHNEARIEFPLPWPDHLPDQWREILERLLARDPDERFESWVELGRELHVILPHQHENAPKLSRVIAWGIDAAAIALATLLILLGIQSINPLIRLPVVPAILNQLALPISLAAFTLVVAGWRQSIGRELVHVRIVNQFGLRPTRRTMLTRSVLRMLSFWLVSLALIAQSSTSFYFALPLIAGVLWLVIDGGWMLARRNGESLHDLIASTRAVTGSAW